MTAMKARKWAKFHRMIVCDDEPTADEPEDPVVAAIVTLLRRRVMAMTAESRGSAREAMARVWIERLPTGYCTTELRPVEDEYAILVDSGLEDSILLGAKFFAHHFDGTVFEVAADEAHTGAAFERYYATLMSQFFLHGRLHRADIISAGYDRMIASRICLEATSFVIAHELGHAMAGHQHFQGDNQWLEQSTIPPAYNAFAQEIEADAIAVQIAFGDMWSRSVGQGEIELRLLAVRLAFQTLQTVERCALVPVFAKHLPAPQRWAGILSFLRERLPQWLLDKHQATWVSLGARLTVGAVSELLPPDADIIEELRDAGWIAASWSYSGSDWRELESAAWQFRLRRPILDILIGHEVCLIEDRPDQTLADAWRVGSRYIDDFTSSLPDWLTGDDSGRGSATSGDLIQYLRYRDRWPEPFRAGTDIPLPLHTMAAAIGHRVAEHRDRRMARKPADPRDAPDHAGTE
ncbi:hypothetical protein [Nocardia shimofusensis]|uniref:hypothetical protein n=1 Tax=Nocardia shimofusensis TaxID=228596 RepID=UPI000834F7E9|nr:hypothetical protein [Nocardia shimofusensis]